MEESDNRNHHMSGALASVAASITERDPSLERSAWATCFCVVNFDVEYGQKIERIYPPQEFPEDILSDIAFSSFPDSTQVTGDVVFCFKLSGRSPSLVPPSPSPNANSNGKSQPFSSSPKLGTPPSSTMTVSVGPSGKEVPPHPSAKQPLYGYSFFRQRKDQSLARGYLQKSVVLLSRFGFVQLFKEVIRIVGESYFQFGDTLLEAVWHNITSWPSPKAKTSVDLPVMGSVLRFKLPHSKSQELVMDGVEYKSAPPKSGLLPPPEPFVSFRGLYSKLWTLWELIIIGEPILIAASSPQTCSDAALALASLIAPIEFTGENRPFFTMHDSDFKYYSETAHPDYDPSVSPADSKAATHSDSATTSIVGARVGSTIIGVTNPYFFKALEHWPHVIVISDTTLEGAKKPTAKPPKRGAMGKSSFKSFSEFKTCLETTHKPYYEPNKTVVAEAKKLAGAHPSHNNGHDDRMLLIRNHFRKFTEAFLQPLEKYFKTLFPAPEQFTLLGGPPALRPFREATFLANLLDADMKTKEINVYRRFIRTPSFVSWYRRKKKQATVYIRRQYTEWLERYDPKPVLGNKNEVEVVDIYLRVRNFTERNAANLPDELTKRYREILDEMLCFLPDELQSSLHVRRKATQPGGSSPIVTGTFDAAMEQRSNPIAASAPMDVPSSSKS